ncbi:MAG TPA: M56 family metallopeptidase, partial [Gemmataceae bacterium]|nr:M56 family metallopeptidase [Gemmataceae bacterium]
MFTSQAAAALPLLGGAAWKGTVVLLLAFVMARVLRRTGAATRHLMWTLTMFSLLVVPLFSFLPQAWQVAVALPGVETLPSANTTPENIPDVPEDVAKPAPLLARADIDQSNVGPALMVGRAATVPSVFPVEQGPAPEAVEVHSASNETWIVLAWFVGALVSALWLFGGWLSLLHLKRHCRRAHSGAQHDMLGEVARQLGIRRTVILLFCSQRTMPMTWGLWRPVVLLPQEAQSWILDRLRVVLIHELGHVRRWDCLAQMLGHLARGLYWFHPLAWLAVRRLRLEQEQACDDLVLDSGASAPDYAEHLLAVTAGLPVGIWTAPVALGMGRGDKLRHRLESLLDAGRNHRPLGRRALL